MGEQKSMHQYLSLWLVLVSAQLQPSSTKLVIDIRFLRRVLEGGNEMALGILRDTPKRTGDLDSSCLARVGGSCRLDRAWARSGL